MNLLNCQNMTKSLLFLILLFAVNAFSEGGFDESLSQYCDLFSPESLASAGEYVSDILVVLTELGVSKIDVIDL